MNTETHAAEPKKRGRPPVKAKVETHSAPTSNETIKIPQAKKLAPTKNTQTANTSLSDVFRAASETAKLSGCSASIKLQQANGETFSVEFSA